MMGKKITCIHGGHNDKGELGLGDKSDRNLPTEITTGSYDLHEGETIEQICFAAASAYAVVNDGTSDHLYSWGENDEGELGLGNTEVETSPKEVKLGEEDNKVIQMSEGGHKTLFAITKFPDKNDVLYGWGRNNSHQVGIHDGAYPFIKSPSVIKEWKTIKEVSGGDVTSSAIVNDGTKDHLYTWGDNGYGQLGNGDSSIHYEETPKEIAIGQELEGEKTIKQISIGSWHSGAVVNDGTTDHLYIWGSNHRGQLGLGLSPDDKHKSYSPLEVSFDDGSEKKTISISLYGHHSSAIINNRVDSLIYLWGENADFESGDGTDLIFTPTSYDGYIGKVGDPTNIIKTDDGSDFYVNITDGTKLKKITDLDLSIDKGTVKVEGGGDIQIGNNHIIVSGLGLEEDATVTITLTSKLGDAVKNIDVSSIKEVKSLSFESVDEISFESVNINVNVMTTESPSNDSSSVKDYKLLIKDTHSSQTWESNVLNKDDEQSITISGLDSETSYSLTIEIEGKESSKVSIDTFTTKDIPFNLKEDSFNINTKSIKGTSFMFNITIDTKPSYDPTSFNHNNLHLYSNDEELKLNFVSFDKTNLYTYKAVNLKPKTEYNNFEFSIHENGSKRITINDPSGNPVVIKTKNKMTMVYVWGTLLLLLLILLIIGAVFGVIWFLKSRNNEGGETTTLLLNMKLDYKKINFNQHN